MAAPTRELEKLIVSRKLAHGANPVTRWMAANIAVAPAIAVQPAADLHAAAGADQGQAHLMTAFRDKVDARFAVFWIDAVYTLAGAEPVP